MFISEPGLFIGSASVALRPATACSCSQKSGVLMQRGRQRNGWHLHEVNGASSLKP